MEGFESTTINTAFCKFFKQKRIEINLTLREFCRINEFEPGNIRKIERGLLAPPQKKEKRLQYAMALGIVFKRALIIGLRFVI
jgi:transcriptional regulator with XRE-family HTH domain